MTKRILRFLTLWLICILALHAHAAGADPLRLFVIGNSFSRNATQYLSQLAKEDGHELVIGRAELGGATLQRYWVAVAASIDDSSLSYSSGRNLLYIVWSRIDVLGKGRIASCPRGCSFNPARTASQHL